MHCRLLFVALAATVAVGAPIAPALAQVRPDPQIRPDPGVVVDGEVGVQVYVTLFDEDEPYHPLVQYRLTLTSAAGDTLRLRTDDAGAVTLLAPAGKYRLTSVRPVTWRGTTYHWDVPVVVRPDMRRIELDPRNAIRNGRAAALRPPRAGQQAFP